MQKVYAKGSRSPALRRVVSQSDLNFSRPILMIVEKITVGIDRLFLLRSR